MTPEHEKQFSFIMYTINHSCLCKSNMGHNIYSHQSNKTGHM